jgi:hypothetical protein
MLLRKYNGPPLPEMRHFKQLEAENARLTKIVGNLTLGCEMLRNIIRPKP